MNPELLERDVPMTVMDQLLRQASGGQGRTVLVSGEAGIGKTALVEQFVGDYRSKTRVFWGACEALFTPRPLGPMYDIARQSMPEIRALLQHEADRQTLFATFLEQLRSPALPAIVVFEDVHWADEATLDLVKYLGRRIEQLPALLIVTYRDDEVTTEHPLSLVVGDLPSRAVSRLHLRPLSEAAVTRMARQAGRPAEQLHTITGGHPFFVREVLVSAVPGVPASVRDAVLARVGRLSQAARGMVELAAVVPTRAELWVLEAILGDASASVLEECLAAAILRLEDGTVAFRHELARQAVEGAISPARPRKLHAQVLRTLLAREDAQIAIARLVHHAALAEDVERVRLFAPIAARGAAAQGAHREAAAHYRTALHFTETLDAEQRAELLERLSYECYLTSQIEEAVQARQAALAIWRALENRAKVGHTLRRRSRLYWFLGNNVEAQRHADAAIAELRGLPADSELAMAFSNRAQLHMVADEVPEAQYWGAQAIQLASELNDYEALCHALNNVGAAEPKGGIAAGAERLEESLRLALRYGYEEHVARAYCNLAEAAVILHDFAAAARYHAAGIAYCEERDLDSWGLYMRGWRARALMDLSDWIGATDDALAVLNVPHLPVAIRIPALLVLGRIRAPWRSPRMGRA